MSTIWQAGTLPWAVNHLIDTACFGSGHPDHQACRAFFDSLRPENRLDEFYCLAGPERCINCGHEWYGALSGHCPSCNEEYLPKTLQRWHWRYAITQTIADGVDSYERLSKSIMVDTKFRLAEYVAKAGIAERTQTFATLFDACQFLGRSIVAVLIGMGLKGTDVYDAANWAAFSGPGLDLLGVDAGGWTRQAQREFVPIIRRAVALHSEHKPVPAVTDILAMDDADFGDRLAAVRAELGAEPVLDGVIVLNTERGRYMLAPLDEAQLLRLRARNIPLQEKQGKWDWLEEIMDA